MTDDGGASRTTAPAAGSSAATDVSLREYNASEFARIRERFGWTLALGAVIWFFIERHLNDLNHENARVASITEKTVTLDTYAANEQQRKSEAAATTEWRKDVDRLLTQSVSRDEFQRDSRTDRRGTVGQWIGLASVVVATTGVVVAWIATH